MALPTPRGQSQLSRRGAVPAGPRRGMRRGALRFATFCSGIEGVSLAWEPLGMVPVFFSEIAAFPSAVLAHRWPHVPNLGDLTKVDGRPWRGHVDILWGSTPCQAVSLAGRRESMADDRGRLFLAFLDRVEEIDPTYTCWENVKGVLSDRHNAFGCLLGYLAGEDVPLVPPGKRWTHAGYVLGPKRAVAWRLFDAQHGGVPQRRERVFVVASARDGADPRDILFEREGLRRDTPPSRPEGPAVAALAAGGVGTCGADDNQAQAGHLIAAFGGGNCSGQLPVTACLTACLTAKGQRLDFDVETFLVEHAQPLCITGPVTHALKAEGADASEDGTGRGNPIIAFSAKDYGADASAHIAPTLRAMGHDGSHANAGGQMAIAFQEPIPILEVGARTGVSTDDPRNGVGVGKSGDPMFCLQATKQHALAYGAAMRGRDGGATIELDPELSAALRGADGGGSKAMVLLARIGEMICARVRRLTPRECERLQGIPDDHTLVPYRNRPASRCPDGPRYKAIGNGLATPDVVFIGQQIQKCHAERAR